MPQNRGREEVRRNLTKAKLRAGDTVLGCWVNSMSPAVVSVLAYSGFDFVVFDAEHLPYDALTLENMIRVAHDVGVTPIVKLPKGETRLLLLALDSGAQGMHFADVSSAQEAEAAVRSARFYPEGERGVAFVTRAGGYGFVAAEDYLRQANEEIMTIMVIEGKRGLESLEEILEVPGIDVISVGPYDLSQSLGIPDQLDHPLMQDAFARIVRLAGEKGIAVGTGSWTMDMARQRIGWGMRYIHWVNDMKMLAHRSTEVVKSFQELLP